MTDRQGPTGERSSEEIRREIDRTRHQMDETVDKIGDKLSAARILDEMWVRIRSGDGAAMLGEAIRDHPRPFALMGLGIGLLAVEQARGRNGGNRGNGHVRAGTTEPAEGRVGPYRGDAIDLDHPEWEHASPGTRVKSRIEDAGSSLKHAAAAVRERAGDVKDAATDGAHKLSEAAHDARGRIADAGHRIAETAHATEERVAEAGHRMADRAGEVAAAARGRAKQGATRVCDGFTRLLEDNPMAIGAIAFGVGIAAGLSAPSTRWEDERVGRRAHALKEDVRALASETAERVKHVAKDAAQAAREELRRQREETGPVQVAVNQLKQSAREVGQAAQDAARQSAESEELSVDGLKSQARQAGRREREASGAEASD